MKWVNSLTASIFILWKPVSRSALNLTDWFLCDGKIELSFFLDTVEK